jgi:fructose-1,6-bisphosphatase/inositol monophosphatase family enzyme
MQISLVQEVGKILNVAQRTYLLGVSSQKGEIGTTNSKGDKSLLMDVAIEEAVLRHIQGRNLPVQIYSEEAGDIGASHKNPLYTFSMDPLDGSVNYLRGKEMLPFGTLVAFFDGLQPILDDVLVAGMIEHTTGYFYIFDGKDTFDQNGDKVTLSPDWEVHKTTPVYLDTYYKAGMKAYTSFAEEVFIRSSGSVVGNLMFTLSNVSACMGGISVRAEEIGAVYALIKGAGGIVLDHEGIPIGGKLFYPKGEYPLIAGNEKVAKFMVSRIAESSEEISF